MTVIGIDPGKKICGICAEDSEKGTLKKETVSAEKLSECLQKYIREFPDAVIVCGDSATGKSLNNIFAENNISVQYSDEKNSTIEARELYWQEHSKPWWAFFLPKSMLCPKDRTDDYASVVIAKKYIKNKQI